ncbi:MAG: chemotaxis protein CheX [Planctomycetota bacterium]
MVDRAVISSFAKATMQTLAEMCHTHAAPRRAKTDGERDPGNGVHAIIGMDGELNGAIGLSMAGPVACKIVGRMVGMEMEEVDSDVVDGVQELVNITIGRAKKLMEDSGLSFQFGLPKTLVGHQFAREDSEEYRTLPLVFTTDVGDVMALLTWRYDSAQ